MAESSRQKWQRYEQALLIAMGCAQGPTSLSMAVYQLLIIPTFHPACCLRLFLADSEGELHVHLLTEHATDLFEAIWQGNAPTERDIIDSVTPSCVEAVATLTPEHASYCREQIRQIDPMGLTDVDLSARDGVSIRCDCFEQNRRHTFAMRSPMSQETQRQSRFLALMMDVVREHVRERRIQEYLVNLGRYLG